MNVRPAFVLTAEEEITLRRVAFGQSIVRAMRSADLTRLRKLRLIEDAKDGPQLTASGKAHFESLPKGVFTAAPRRTAELAPSNDSRRDRR